MYQRQVSKQGLSGVVVDAKADAKTHFSPEELKVSMYSTIYNISKTNSFCDSLKQNATTMSTAGGGGRGTSPNFS